MATRSNDRDSCFKDRNAKPFGLSRDYRHPIDSADSGWNYDSGSNQSPDLSEREGDDNFTVVEKSSPGGQPREDAPPTYASLRANLPYPLPGGSGGAPQYSPQPPGAVAANADKNKPFSHPLEGVVFSLSPKLTTDSELDQMSNAVDSVMNRIKNLEWGTFDYNFSLEQSVIDSDLSVDGVRIANSS